ncbi:NADP-dependent oxidoreductase domain-containing protein [Diplogelasinospora grovesii]|uniref:NADP-dependent oxidoreductase domain-containing protein n=1 Tax=Diplogelasinospora grovesii TaxID=303347 RepID=A0AAN6MY10_9PEZI|nr:NADP-dependent oxidoreductase domain-containing protein [Diplogelasinospora grovesii]
MAPPAQLPTRKLGKNGPHIPAVGFGLMGLSVAYGSVGTDEERLKVLDRAWELGYVNWDSADMYGDSEDLVGKWFRLHPERRQDIFLATKFGLRPGLRDDGTPGLRIDSSPEYCRQQCEASLRRLGTDYIDLYYVHRVDGKTPIERTMAELVKLKQEGKVKHLGISASSPETVRRACAVDHIDAYQVEYSPWALDIEGPDGKFLLQTCRELGVAVFAYSPLGRGIMTGQIKSADDFEEGDMRRLFPRFSKENFSKNLVLVERFQEIANKKGCTPGQLTMAWLMAQGDDIFPIPGTKNIRYLEENVGAVHVHLSGDEEAEIRKCINEIGVAGMRTPPSLLDEFNDTPPL